MAKSLYEALGGELQLRLIIDEFVELVFEDAMIGSFFRRADRERIRRFELQHAAELLGGPHRYQGRALERAHAPHRILGGHFDRRIQLLREVLARHEAPEAVVQAWITQNQALRAQITADPEGVCTPGASADP